MSGLPISDWVARLGLVFPDKAKADFDQFIREVNNENVEYLSLKKEFDVQKETKPTFEQISQERILDEANKNVQVLKSLETILQERTQSYATFLAAQGKYKPSFEIFQYCEGTLRQALDALFVFLEQELQQARLQQTLGQS
jgi:vancomycin resistance protein YoaR